jgi:hypothetical protein
MRVLLLLLSPPFWVTYIASENNKKNRRRGNRIRHTGKSSLAHQPPGSQAASPFRNVHYTVASQDYLIIHRFTNNYR